VTSSEFVVIAEPDKRCASRSAC